MRGVATVVGSRWPLPGGGAERGCVGEHGQAEKAKDQRIKQLEAKLVTNNEVIAELLEENVKAKKRVWGILKGVWVPHAVRDQIVD